MWLETYGVKLMSVFPGIQFTGKRMQERKEEHKARDSKRLNGGVIHDVKELQENLLDRFFRAENDSDHMTENEVRGLTLTIVFAGSKTTNNEGTIQPTRFADAHALPYLNACIHETFRMHPPFSAMYERIVPAPGATICGQFVPGGTLVGCNPWVIQRDRSVFGEDADTYRPERWSTEDAEKLKLMHRSMFQFGGGEHICLGRHISLLEIFKVVPTLLSIVSEAIQQWKLADPDLLPTLPLVHTYKLFSTPSAHPPAPLPTRASTPPMPSSSTTTKEAIEPAAQPSCPFCAIALATPPSRALLLPPTSSPSPPATTPPLDPVVVAHVILSTPHLVAFLDHAPISRGHVLLVVREHVEKLGDNNGARAAQVVPHVHFHIIPRVDDVPEVKARSWTVFGKGQREELDEDDAVVLVKRMRERLRNEVERLSKGTLQRSVPMDALIVW
ncbi:MAG: hypothetical protein ASARMPRED_004679 [Alectoria sarmentosa]|nr:MAG: hypothetical protein ASARMPRED_004679 [Alectoria sarmentosa]